MIQPFSLGTSITRIDGGSIATGTIDGSDAILSGSLTADRINASSIQASTVFIPAVANGLNSGVGGTWIDGGAIRTGTVDTNRLNASTIVTAINGQATTISGSKITTGTITVGHLTADTLTAGKIKASLLDVNGMIQIVNGGSITKLTGGGIATGTIDATKLVLKPGGMGTINVDPMLQDPSIWGYEGWAFSFQTVSDAPVGTRVIRSFENYNGSYPQDKTNYPIDRNKRYRVRFWARSVGSPGMLYFCLRQYKADGVTVCDANGGRSPYQPNPAIVPTSWTEYSYEWNSSHWQPDMKFVRMDWLLNYNSGATYMEICYPRFEEMVNAELIVDGAITANTIRTGEFYSQGTGGTYGSFNPATGIATGFKLAHTPFNANNVWGRSQSVQAEFGSNVLVHGYPLGPALGIPLSALDFPPLDQLSGTSRVFYRGNIDTATRGGAPNIACLTVTRDRWDTTNKIMRFTFKLQPSALSDNLDGLRYAKVAITRNNVAVKCSAKCSMTVNATAKTVTRNDGGSFVADGFVAGDIPLFTGFTNTTNNNVGYLTCAGVTASTITLNAGTTGLVNETATAAQVATYDGPTSTDLGTFYVPLKDRLYAHATDSDPSNAVYITWTESDAGVSTGVPALAVTLYNAYGASATYYYVSRTVSYGDGIALFSSGSSLPPGVYGYVPPGGGGGGSGGAGGGCTPAGTPFETAQGVVPVETVQVGDLALAYDENTLKPHYARVTRVFVHENRQLYSVQTDRGELICSHDHRLALVTDVHSVKYPPARELEAGDLIYYRLPSGVVVTALVTKVTPLDRFETVYHCTLESGHVYVAGGFLAHNIMKIIDRDRD